MKNLRLNQLPQAPGVYFFKNQKGEVLYVGKALKIKNRVKSHFRPLLLAQIETVDYIEVASEIEALLLEANLIKKFKPKYNTRLKDDKSYLYFKITMGEDLPKFL